jgi:hypothetical protein
LRAENEKDTRAKTIALTDGGVNIAIESVKIVEKVDMKFFSGTEHHSNSLSRCNNLQEFTKVNQVFFNILLTIILL